VYVYVYVYVCVCVCVCDFAPMMKARRLLHSAVYCRGLHSFIVVVCPTNQPQLSSSSEFPTKHGSNEFVCCPPPHLVQSPLWRECGGAAVVPSSHFFLPYRPVTLDSALLCAAITKGAKAGQQVTQESGSEMGCDGGCQESDPLQERLPIRATTVRGNKRNPQRSRRERGWFTTLLCRVSRRACTGRYQLLTTRLC